MIALGRAANLAGKRYGKLVAVEPIRKTKSRSTVWKCICDCGGVSETWGSSLTSGRTLSCGCLLVENSAMANTKHGLSRHISADSFYHMHDRCYNSSNKSYSNYGGRGIKVEPAWFSLETFIADMGIKPPNKSLERLDNNKDYGPSNCEWASIKDQNRNRRSTKEVIYRGETYKFIDLVEIKKVNYRTTLARLNLGWSVEQAFDKPV